MKINQAKRQHLRDLFNADMKAIHDARKDGSWDPEERHWGRDRRRCVALALAFLNRTPYERCEAGGVERENLPRTRLVLEFVHSCLDDAEGLSVSAWMGGALPTFEHPDREEEAEDEQQAS